jgi:hypothetical protein
MIHGISVKSRREGHSPYMVEKIFAKKRSTFLRKLH